MDKVEMGKLLTQISAVDNRQVTTATIEMWWRINGDLDYSDCEQAIPMAFRESKQGEYFSPQMLRAMVKRIREERAVQLEQDNRRALEAEIMYAPAPKCREHGLRPDLCEPCRQAISRRGKEFPNHDLHEWAMANIYDVEVMA